MLVLYIIVIIAILLLVMLSVMKHKKQLLTILVFLGFTVWWLVLRSKYPAGNAAYQHFTATYGVMALFGALWGIINARKWGGFHSVLGLSLLFFAFGLFAQEFGQLAYNYYIYVKKVDIPYPSIGDIGYFGSVVLYATAAFFLAKVAGAHTALKQSKKRWLVFLIPFALVGLSYWLFLRGYVFNWHHPLTIFLDFGYPFGEAIYISIGILAFLLSRKLLGGLMRNKILFLIVALCAQYAADFNFVYQASKGTWADGGYGDYLYLFAYFVLSMALLNVVIPRPKVQAETPEEPV